MAPILTTLVVVVAVVLWFVTQSQSEKWPYHGSASKARAEIETVFLESWRDYVKHGWGYDIYSPVAQSGRNMANNGQPMGWMIVDTLDTLMLMYNTTESHKEEFRGEIRRATEWIDKSLSFDIDQEVNVFETTIRMLGGLLSGYHLATELDLPQSYSSIYLDKATDLGHRLARAFLSTEIGIPFSSINLSTGKTVKNHVDDGASATSEFTTLQLEFKYLAYLTGNNTFWELVEGVYEPMYKNNNLLSAQYQGLVPIFTYPENGLFRGQTIRLGSRADSFYEYLLKQYQLTGEDLYYELYKLSMDGVKRNLLGKSMPNKYLFIGEKENGLRGPLSPKMDHLVCFMGGLLAMGATDGYPIEEARKMSFWNARREEDWKIANDYTEGCYQMYAQVPTGIAPEIALFNVDDTNEDYWKSEKGDFWIKPFDRHNIQRPEEVESIMFLYQLSHNKKYRQWGYNILKSFENNTCVDCDNAETRRYTSLNDVIEGVYRDNMESFWLAETLKYLYLLFTDDVDLRSMVFNTEAHPFPVLSKEELAKKGLKTNWSISSSRKIQ
ncbi:Endoplasmic reticulum mannosyl-oligosaccharide 1,2-alpha-mannosidase [Nakaseomyces bracarensis]|uniref:alpha-1,2-Mannosidase n=1 Tax=Nakaseomyces bracarensis TaxID=273131 RepID=A0ABR4NSW9_9SACH